MQSSIAGTMLTSFDPAQRASIRVTLPMGLAIWLVVVGTCWSQLPRSPEDVPDSTSYLALAEGNQQAVNKPFSDRVLTPLVVRALHATLGTEPTQGFLALGLVLLALFCCGLSWLLLRGGVPLALLPALLLIPLPRDLLLSYYLPDLPHAGLAALFFCALFAKRLGAAAVLLFLLQMTRESTLLLTLIICVVFCMRKQWRPAALFAVATGCGVVAVSLLSRGGAGNVHAMSGLLYMLLKVGFNTAKNVLGLELWTDSLDNLKNFEPLWTMDLPAWLPTGRLRQVGILGFDASCPLRTLMYWLTTFGVLPTLTLKWLWQRDKAGFRAETTATQITLAYGLICLAIAPALGAAVSRLVGYAWPAMLIAGPLLVIPGIRKPSTLFQLAAANLVCAWLPWLMPEMSSPVVWLAVVVGLAAALHVWAARTRFVGWSPSAAQPSNVQ